MICEILKVLNEYATLISAVMIFLTILVALYLGDWKERLRRPKLKLCFNENKEYPYFQTLAFERFGQPIEFAGQTIYIFRPGFNARLKVINTGKSTAKNVQARVEKIELYKGNNKTAPTRHYHPTIVKWSGEPNWGFVDIFPKSHFFLDVFWAKNETSSEIFSFNDTRYRHRIKEELLREIIKQDINPSEEVYWNVWIDTSFERGIPIKYHFEGNIVIYFIIDAENCDPLRFEALVNWSSENWNQPTIRIRQG